MVVGREVEGEVWVGGGVCGGVCGGEDCWLEDEQVRVYRPARLSERQDPANGSLSQEISDDPFLSDVAYSTTRDM